MTAVFEHVEHGRVLQVGCLRRHEVAFGQTEHLERFFGHAFVIAVMKGEILADLPLVLVPLSALVVNASLDCHLVCLLLLSLLSHDSNQVHQLDKVLFVKAILRLSESHRQ